MIMQLHVQLNNNERQTLLDGKEKRMEDYLKLDKLYTCFKDPSILNDITLSLVQLLQSSTGIYTL